MKKILVTRKLLQSNEDRLKETYDSPKMIFSFDV